MKRLSILLSFVFILFSSVKSQNTDAQSKKSAEPFYVIQSVESVPGEVLIKFKDIVSAADVTNFAQQIGIQMVEELPKIHVRHYRIQADKTIEQVLEECRANTNVEYAEPNYIYHALETPNDPAYSKLWGLNNEGQTDGTVDADIDAPEAWEKEKGSREVIVSIIDTGIDYNHPDLAANIWINTNEIPGNGVDDDHNGFVDDEHGWDFVNNDNNPIDDHDHGSHCAGTIGAVGNNGKGVVGVNWTVRLMPLKFLNSGGSGSTDDAVKAIIYATDNGANILSNSWGGGGSSQALEDAIRYASAHNVLFIAAAGNESKDNDVKPNYPSNYEVENIIAVAATDDRDDLASFSNYGALTVDLSAPGVEIYSTVTGNGYKYLSGTSMATPHVAGAAALLWAHYLPDVQMRAIKYRIFGAVDRIGNLENYVLLDGRLNVNNGLTEKPLISLLQRPTDTADESGPYPVEAAVVDDDSVRLVKLFYRVSGSSTGSDTLNLPMSKPFIYHAELPGAPTGSVVEYQVSAADNDGNRVETVFQSFRVGKQAGGCCGSTAVSVKLDGPRETTYATIFFNLLLFLGPPVLLKRIRKRRKK